MAHRNVCLGVAKVEIEDVEGAQGPCGRIPSQPRVSVEEAAPPLTALAL
eukprot:CAMPEP_0182875122 /NCGR_PEP_ID=MMETSP0034_2-20130328/13354_1 /TAXON_ID=156128 /ORGANISM="Nephroselmis pyriformis, Strain CCMP717" /LENGTH=48 /DNA_ID= /DNA_START= /DNA_END= /DNA_ORIENTATION=